MKGTSFIGSKGEYILGDLVDNGAEGSVYKLANRPDLLVKIYNDGGKAGDNIVATKETEDKLRTMMTLVRGGDVDRFSTVAWPVDIIYRRTDRKFAGFVMPAVKGQSIYILEAEGLRNDYFGEYDWRNSIQAAYNLACMTAELHKKNIVLGDWNIRNIRITKKGAIVLIDNDGFTIRSAGGRLFKSKGARPEYMAPEMQGIRNLSDPRAVFNEYTDRYGLSVHIFELLMNGEHPFNARQADPYAASMNAPKMMMSILKGESPYINGIGRIPRHSPDYCRMMPPYIKKLFNRVFSYNATNCIKPETIKARPSAEEWRNALNTLKQDLRSCNRFRHHVYWKGAPECPWCAMGMDDKCCIKKIPDGYQPLFTTMSENKAVLPTHPVRIRPDEALPPADLMRRYLNEPLHRPVIQGSISEEERYSESEDVWESIKDAILGLAAVVAVVISIVLI